MVFFLSTLRTVFVGGGGGGVKPTDCKINGSGCRRHKREGGREEVEGKYVRTSDSRKEWRRQQIKKGREMRKSGRKGV